MFLKEIKSFILKNRRLPLLEGDSIEYMNENDEISTKSGKNALKETFGDDFKPEQDFLSKKLINYEEIDSWLELKKGTSKKIIEGKAKSDIEGRREIEHFFSHDFLKKEDDGFNAKCLSCKSSCKQLYYATVINCRNYKKK